MTAAVALDPGANGTKSTDVEAFGPWSREFLGFAELFAISGLAFAQPAFDLLSKNVSVLVARQTQPWQVIALTVAFLLGPPAAAFAVELVSALFGGRVRRWVHAVLVGVFAAVLAEEVVKHATSLTSSRLVAVGVVGGLGAMLLVRYVDVTRTFLRFLSIAPLIFAVSFLGFSPASKTVFRHEPPSVSGAAIGTPKRVVMIVMDEFPLETLLDGTGHIDATLYPNFARLAGASTWYRNTSTVAPYTDWAVPALTTGQIPKTSQLPVATDHPNSIFRLLGGAYRMNVHESVTKLCPDKLCVAANTGRSGLGTLAATADDAVSLWKDFAGPETTQPAGFTPPLATPSGLLGATSFIESLQPGRERVFDFLHVMLPHQPWHLLPTLQDSGYIDADLASKSNLTIWHDDTAAAIGRERHVLQTMATDALLGRIIDKLQRLGAWDDSVVALTADHGMAFTSGEPTRAATDGNADQILWVPMFVKAPGQTAGVIDDRPMETIDLVPTIAGLLHAKIPWHVDGVSALGKPRPEFPRRLFQFKLDALQPPSAPLATDDAPLKFPASLWSRVLAARATEPVGDPALRPYRIPPYGALIGRPAAPLVVDDPAGPSRIFVLNPSVFDRVDPTAPLMPWTSLQGSVIDLPRVQPLAFAVNGVIAGIGNAKTGGETGGFFWASLAPQFFRAGANQVVAYAISGPADHPVLDPIPIDPRAVTAP